MTAQRAPVHLDSKYDVHKTYCFSCVSMPFQGSLLADPCWQPFYIWVQPAPCFKCWIQMQRGCAMAPFWHGCSTGPACWHALTFEFNIDAFTHWIQIQGTAKHESLALDFESLKNGSMLNSTVEGLPTSSSLLEWHSYIYVVHGCTYLNGDARENELVGSPSLTFIWGMQAPVPFAFAFKC